MDINHLKQQHHQHQKHQISQELFDPISITFTNNTNNNTNNNDNNNVNDNKSASSQKEMVGGCVVCGQEVGFIDNALIYCDGDDCQIGVHVGCYGVEIIPKDDWYCKPCSMNIKPERCELCPAKYGAFKQTTNGKWCHVVCALYIPEVAFGNLTRMEPIMLEKIDSRRLGNHVCILCEMNGRDKETARTGFCMSCQYTSCPAKFHVTCAQYQGFLCEETTNVHTINYKAFCPQHIEKYRNFRKPKFKILPPYRPEDPNRKQQLLLNDDNDNQSSRPTLNLPSTPLSSSLSPITSQTKRPSSSELMDKKKNNQQLTNNIMRKEKFRNNSGINKHSTKSSISSSSSISINNKNSSINSLNIPNQLKKASSSSLTSSSNSYSNVQFRNGQFPQSSGENHNYHNNHHLNKSSSSSFPTESLLSAPPCPNDSFTVPRKRTLSTSSSSSSSSSSSASSSESSNSSSEDSSDGSSSSSSKSGTKNQGEASSSSESSDDNSDDSDSENESSPHKNKNIPSIMEKSNNLISNNEIKNQHNKHERVMPMLPSSPSRAVSSKLNLSDEGSSSSSSSSSSEDDKDDGSSDSSVDFVKTKKKKNNKEKIAKVTVNNNSLKKLPPTNKRSSVSSINNNNNKDNHYSNNKNNKKLKTDRKIFNVDGPMIDGNNDICTVTNETISIVENDRVLKLPPTNIIPSKKTTRSRSKSSSTVSPALVLSDESSNSDSNIDDTDKDEDFKLSRKSSSSKLNRKRPINSINTANASTTITKISSNDQINESKIVNKTINNRSRSSSSQQQQQSSAIFKMKDSNRISNTNSANAKSQRTKSSPRASNTRKTTAASNVNNRKTSRPIKKGSINNELSLLDNKIEQQDSMNIKGSLSPTPLSVVTQSVPVASNCCHSMVNAQTCNHYVSPTQSLISPAAAAHHHHHLHVSPNYCAHANSGNASVSVSGQSCCNVAIPMNNDHSPMLMDPSILMNNNKLQVGTDPNNLLTTCNPASLGMFANQQSQQQCSSTKTSESQSLLRSQIPFNSLMVPCYGPNILPNGLQKNQSESIEMPSTPQTLEQLLEFAWVNMSHYQMTQEGVKDASDLLQKLNDVMQHNKRLENEKKLLLKHVDTLKKAIECTKAICSMVQDDCNDNYEDKHNTNLLNNIGSSSQLINNNNRPNSIAQASPHDHHHHNNSSIATGTNQQQNQSSSMTMIKSASSTPASSAGVNTPTAAINTSLSNILAATTSRLQTNINENGTSDSNGIGGNGRLSRRSSSSTTSSLQQPNTEPESPKSSSSSTMPSMIGNNGTMINNNINHHHLSQQQSYHHSNQQQLGNSMATPPTNNNNFINNNTSSSPLSSLNNNNNNTNNNIAKTTIVPESYQHYLTKQLNSTSNVINPHNLPPTTGYQSPLTSGVGGGSSSTVYSSTNGAGHNVPQLPAPLVPFNNNRGSSNNNNNNNNYESSHHHQMESNFNNNNKNQQYSHHSQQQPQQSHFMINQNNNNNNNQFDQNLNQYQNHRTRTLRSSSSSSSASTSTSILNGQMNIGYPQQSSLQQQQSTMPFGPPPPPPFNNLHHHSGFYNKN